MKSKLYVNRSISACLKETTTMLLSNLTDILKNTWIPLLSLAAFFTCILFTIIPNKALYDWSNTHLVLSFSLLIAIYIAFFVCILWSLAKSFSFINGFGLKDNLKRCSIPVLLFLALGCFIISCLGGNIHKLIYLTINTLHVSSEYTGILTGIFTCVVMIIVGCVILPFQYAFTHYIIDSKIKLRNILKKEYCIGLHYWGYLFLSTLITTLIVAIISIVIATPLVIIICADLSNSYGIIMGDTDGTPSYFNLLIFFTSIVCSFIILYILLWQLYTNCYICGTINLRYTEKLNHKQIAN